MVCLYKPCLDQATSLARHSLAVTNPLTPFVHFPPNIARNPSTVLICFAVEVDIAKRTDTDTELRYI
jgi:hypothetical protein